MTISTKILAGATVLFAATVIYGIAASPALAESCPRDKVWSPSQGGCITLPESGAGNTNTATGGSAVAGAISSSSALANGGKGGAGGKGGSASATGGKATGGKATASGGKATGGKAVANGRVNNRVNVSTRNDYEAAASTAAAVSLPGQFAANCFGDVNPSGAFGASVQGLGFGVAATSSKASNICALVALAGPAAGVAYLQRMDPNVPRSIIVGQPTGRVTCPATHPVFVAGKGCRK